MIKLFKINFMKLDFAKEERLIVFLYEMLATAGLLNKINL